MGVFQPLRGLTGEGSEVWAIDLETHERTFLTTGNRPRYASTGHLLFSTPDGVLMAQPIDPATAELTGPAVPVLEDVTVIDGLALYAVSESGSLIYAVGGTDVVAAGRRELVWVDRDGREEPLDMEPQEYLYPRISPQGNRLVAAVVAEGDTDLWVFNPDRGSRVKITFGGNNRFFPVWNPAGDSLTFADGNAEPNALLIAPADGSGAVDTLLAREGLQFPTSWSSDGQTLAYYERLGAANRDVWVLPAGGDPESFLITPFEERAPFFSPDGRWLAYVSDRSGQNEVYMQAYPGPGSELIISTAGGTEPVWSPDSSELFYRTEDQLMVVGLADPASPGTPRPLWPDPYLRDPGNQAAPNYDIAADGQRFLMLRDEGAADSEIILVQNWFEELRQRLGN